MHEMYCSLGYLIDIRVFCFVFYVHHTNTSASVHKIKY